MGWKDRIKDEQPSAEAKEPKKGSWRDRVTEDVSPGESAFRGAIDGASMGFVDELAGALEAAGSTVGVRGLGGDSLSDVRLETDEEDKQSLGDTYRGARDAKREAYKKAEKANPTAYLAGDLGGSVLSTMAVPGGSSLKAAAAIGGVQGLGRSEADATKGDVPGALLDTAEGAGVGLAGGLAAKGVAKAAPYVGKALGKTGEMLGSAATDVDEGAANYYLKNASDVNAAKSLPEVTDAFLAKTKDLEEGLSSASGKGYSILEKSGLTTDAGTFTAPLRSEAEGLVRAGSYTPDRARAVNLLTTVADNVEKDAAKTGGQLTLDKGKALIMQLDNEITKAADKKLGDAGVVKALSNARQSVDQYLKKAVPEYADHMAELAEQTKAVKAVADKFRTPSGAENLLKRVASGKDDRYRKVIQELDEREGTQFLKDLQDARVKEAFSKESSSLGSVKRTLLGSTLGTAAGAMVGNPVLGAAVGSAAATAADKVGGRIYKKILDGSIKAGKYGAYLKKVFEERGPAAVAAAHAVLMDRDPEYRKAVETEE